MIYREYGKFSISVLAFGLFGPQFLTQGGSPGEYLDAVAKGIKLGVSYFDLGFPQRYIANRELVSDCGKLLKNAPVVTALRINVHTLDSAGALEESVRRDLKAYGLERVGLLQLWGVDRVTWHKILETGMLERADQLVRNGLAEELTLHFTDDRFYLRPILETKKFSGVALDFSFLEASRIQGSFKTAHDFGLGVVVHGTTKDGRLLERIPPDIKAAWAEHKERTPAGWALGLAWDNPEITSVLVEAMTPEQAEEYVSYAGLIEHGQPGVRGALLGKKIKDLYDRRRQIQCQLCRCCMPCPLGIDAPRIAELYNEYLIFGNADIPALSYQLEQHNGSGCIRCLKCARACPREFLLPDIISDADRLFSSHQAENAG